MTTRTDVAQWMIHTIESRQYLYQEDAVEGIMQKFGSDWVYENENGNYAISPKVLAEFRRLHGGRFEWDRSDKSWSHA